MKPVLSQGGWVGGVGWGVGVSGVQGQDGCLAKMDTGGQFECSACRGDWGGGGIPGSPYVVLMCGEQIVGPNLRYLVQQQFCPSFQFDLIFIAQ